MWRRKTSHPSPGQIEFTEFWNDVTLSANPSLFPTLFSGRRLQSNTPNNISPFSVLGDIDNDGVTDIVDADLLAKYFRTPTLLPSLSSLTPNQQRWIDFNQDGSLAKAGDVAGMLRALLGSSAYLGFHTVSCPRTPVDPLVVWLAPFGAQQNHLENVVLEAEVGAQKYTSFGRVHHLSRMDCL